MRCAAEAFLLSLALLSAQAAAAPTLRMAIDNATQMPMARIDGERVLGGMTHALGALLAERMALSISYQALPRKRLLAQLQSGQADLVCTYLPSWLPGEGLQWSPAFFRQNDLLLTRADAPAPRQLRDLTGRRIGTTLGFVYAELEQQLGSGFVREDAASAEASLRKLAAGRLQHAVVEQRLLRHLQREGRFTTDLHAPLPLSPQRTHCALGPKAPVSLQQLSRAIATIERDGSLAQLYALRLTGDGARRANA